jgi:tungsten cofactor oxidoreducase radical SAM maturase
MPKITTNSKGQFTIPQDFLLRRRLEPQTEYWLDERDGDLVLHFSLPDAKKLYIEVTTACNLNCHTCIRHSWVASNANMSMDIFQKILDSLPGLPQLERVVFTSFGEPLVHPKIFDMIAAIRGYGLDVTLGSNGILLSEKVARKLVDLGVDLLMVSIDGVKPEVYEDVRDTQLSDVLNNLKRFNQIKEEAGTRKPTLGIEFVALKKNKDDLLDITDLATEINASQIIVTNVLPYSEEMNAEKLYGYEPMEPLKTSRWPAKSNSWGRWGVIELPRMHFGSEQRCRFVHNNSIVVGWDGEVAPCYALSHSYEYYAIDGIKKSVQRHTFGDIKKNTLAEIWMNEDFVRYRSEVRAFHFPSCADCDIRDTCDLRLTNEACWGMNPSCSD